MKKLINYDKNARKELKKFNKEVQQDFVALITILEEEGNLGLPEGKKISKNLFEMRLTGKNAYRGFYAYVFGNYIVILHFFQKKTQKTPLRNIELAERRLRKYG